MILRTTAILRDPRSYDWVDVRRYDLEAGDCARRVSELLLGDPTYVDTYLGDDQSMNTSTHGPVVLVGLSDNAFSMVSRVEAARVLSCEMRIDSVLRPEIESLLDEFDDPRIEYYHLDTTVAVQSETAWMLTWFEEIVVRSRRARQLLVVVAGAD